MHFCHAVPHSSVKICITTFLWWSTCRLHRYKFLSIFVNLLDSIMIRDKSELAKWYILSSILLAFPSSEQNSNVTQCCNASTKLLCKRKLILLCRYTIRYSTSHDSSLTEELSTDLYEWLLASNIKINLAIPGSFTTISVSSSIFKYTEKGSTLDWLS